MCRRFTLQAPPEILAKTFILPHVPQIEPRFNIAPGQPVAAIRNTGQHNLLGFISWGNVTDKVDDSDHLPDTLRAESVLERPETLHALRCNRCIIPASGFYTWVTKNNRNQPCYIRLSNSGIMGFAGLWEQWQAPDGTQQESCSILTTTSNDLITPLQDRMPVILQQDDYELWLDRNRQDPVELQSLFQPYPSEFMITHDVPDLVNNIRFDSAACIVQV